MNLIAKIFFLVLFLLIIFSYYKSRTINLNINERKKICKIPKKVYYTHENEYEKKKFSKIIEFNKINNPELEFIFYSDIDRINFLKLNYPEFYKIYNRIHPHYGAIKADIFRVLILYHYGGIYVDIKTKISNIYEIVKNESFACCSYDNNFLYIYNKLFGNYISNFFISSEKYGNIITEIKNEMYRRLNNFGKITLPFKYYLLSSNNISGMSSHYYTGPGLFTDIISKYPGVLIIRNSKYLIYDKNFYSNIFKKLNGTYHISKERMIRNI